LAVVTLALLVHVISRENVRATVSTLTTRTVVRLSSVFFASRVNTVALEPSSMFTLALAPGAGVGNAYDFTTGRRVGSTEPATTCTRPGCFPGVLSVPNCTATSTGALAHADDDDEEPDDAEEADDSDDAEDSDEEEIVEEDEDDDDEEEDDDDGAAEEDEEEGPADDEEEEVEDEDDAAGIMRLQYSSVSVTVMGIRVCVGSATGV
jgi:hypothetical protein